MAQRISHKKTRIAPLKRTSQAVARVSHHRNAGEGVDDPKVDESKRNEKPCSPATEHEASLPVRICSDNCVTFERKIAE